jgi:hypothetical protein
VVRLDANTSPRRMTSRELAHDVEMQDLTPGRSTTDSHPLPHTRSENGLRTGRCSHASRHSPSPTPNPLVGFESSIHRQNRARELATMSEPNTTRGRALIRDRLSFVGVPLGAIGLSLVTLSEDSSALYFWSAVGMTLLGICLTTAGMLRGWYRRGSGN